jgi:dsDNA-specific endonuclease/ATPase MutS2
MPMEKTLFFIDELGSGSDPNLGGAFAEVVLEELLKKTFFRNSYYPLFKFKDNGK